MSTTVQGNIKSLGAAVVAGSFVRFWLRGAAGNPPRVNGTALIAPTQGAVYYKDFVCDGSGAISGTLYSTRDNAGTGDGEIEAGGSKQAVWYGVQAFSAGKGGPETPHHAKNGATLDISSDTPITTTPVVTAPTGDTTYARLDGGNSPFTGLAQFNAGILTQKLEQVRYSSHFASINSAVTDVGSSVGLVVVPPTQATGSWTAPANSIAIIDQRFTNDTGLLEGVLANQHSHWSMSFHAGANDSYESNSFSGPVGLAVNAFADSGGISGVNTKANVVGLFAGVVRAAASNRPVWSANFNTSYQSSGSASTAIGLEVDLNNSGSADDTNQYGRGIQIISGAGVSGKKAGVALMINNSTGSGGADSWERGIGVNNYAEVGLFMQSGSSRTADIYIVPPADDTSSAIYVSNHANNAAKFKVDSSGNVTGSLFTLNAGGFFSSDAAAVAGSGVVRLGQGNSVNFRNAANNGDITGLTIDGNNVVQVGSSGMKVVGATPSVSASQLGIGTTAGFGNGTGGTAVTTTTKGTGSGPTTPQTIVNYLEINIGGSNYWIGLMQ